MRGIGYLIVEVVILLVASAAIGYLIGMLIHRRQPRRAVAGGDVAALETKALVLEGRLSESQQELEEVKRQLTMERLRSSGDSPAN